MKFFPLITHRFTRALCGLRGNTGVMLGLMPLNWQAYAQRRASHEWACALGPIRLDVFWWGFYEPLEIVVIADRIEPAQCATSSTPRADVPTTEEGKTMDYQQEKLDQAHAEVGYASKRGYFGGSLAAASTPRDDVPSAHRLGQMTEALSMATSDLEDVVDALFSALGVSFPAHGEDQRGAPEPVPSDIMDAAARQMAARISRIQHAAGRLRSLRAQLVG